MWSASPHPANEQGSRGENCWIDVCVTAIHSLPCAGSHCNTRNEENKHTCICLCWHYERSNNIIWWMDPTAEFQSVPTCVMSTMCVLWSVVSTLCRRNTLVLCAWLGLLRLGGYNVAIKFSSAFHKNAFNHYCGRSIVCRMPIKLGFISWYICHMHIDHYCTTVLQIIKCLIFSF